MNSWRISTRTEGWDDTQQIRVRLETCGLSLEGYAELERPNVRFYRGSQRRREEQNIQQDILFVKTFQSIQYYYDSFAYHPQLNVTPPLMADYYFSTCALQRGICARYCHLT